ncbi:MAG: hypothetical protein P0111_02870 [Nitrospira sp.]|nr:hypothetical protein [Nitrospira sp.]
MRPKDEDSAIRTFRKQVRRILKRGHDFSWVDNEDDITEYLRAVLQQIGDFYRTAEGVPLFFRKQNRRLYEINSRPESEFSHLVTFLSDLSSKLATILRCVDRLRADISQNAEIVTVHSLAYNNADASVIAVNDFGGGMWHRKRGGEWEWKPNGSEGIIFWLPVNHVEPWKPEIVESDELSALDWLLKQPHFAEDTLTIEDQQLLLCVLFLAPLFPSRNKVRPIPVHLGGGKGRSYDTGKTMTGKMIGAVWAGSAFEPTPVRRAGDRGEEDLQLTLMNQPYVLLDNVDTDLKWLNDFLATYATGARATKRMLYHDTDVVHIDYRGRLTITSRDPKFKREDVASRLIPLRFRPIEDHERKEEWDLLAPVLDKRSQIWGSILTVAGKTQDALPTLIPPRLPGRLADFIHFGWVVSAVRDKSSAWEEMASRLRVAQAGFVIDDEPLFAILGTLLTRDDIRDIRTSDFYALVRTTAQGLKLEWPRDAASCTRRIKEVKELIEGRLDVQITLRTLNGHSLVSIERGKTWPKEEEVSEVTGYDASLMS